MRQTKPFTAELQLARKDGQPITELFQAIRTQADPIETTTLPAPVVTDNQPVLQAIAELGSKLDRFLATDQAELEKIQVEIADISGRIKATKVEMAQLRHPLAENDKFTQASEELHAVVSATESATNAIISSAEELDEIVQELKAQMPEGYQSSRVNDMNDAIVRIFESCNFQDLAGQRITKVVKTLTFIEERVESMLNLWNKQEFAALPVPQDLDKKDGDLQLTGPKEVHDGDTSISQSEIDALFD